MGYGFRRVMKSEANRITGGGPSEVGRKSGDTGQEKAVSKREPLTAEHAWRPGGVVG